MSETNDIATNSPPSRVVKSNKRQRRKPRKPWWVWGLWAFFGLCCIVIIGAALAWSNRYALLEDLAVDALASDGIDAELDINSLSKTHAVIDNVRLSHNGDLFFSAERVTANYLWRDALEGRMKSVTIAQARAHITIDENGTIIDGWRPPSSPQDKSSSDDLIPANGVAIQNGVFFIKSPYGAAQVSGDIDFKTKQNFTATLTMAPTDFIYDELNLSGGGKFDVRMHDETMDVNSQITLSRLSHPAVDAKNLSLTLNGRPNIEEKSFQGRAELTLENLETAQAFMDKGHIIWDGDIAQTSNFYDFSGSLQTDLTSVQLPDPARREDLATTLSFYAPLSKSPVAQHFVPEVRAALNGLLTRSNIVARTELTRNDAEFTLKLNTPALITSNQTQLTIKPKPDMPLYHFDKTAQTITAHLGANFSNPVGLSLSNINFNASSSNGIELAGVNNFKANITTNRPWAGNGLDGRPVRLAPISINMNYNGANANMRTVTLTGGLDYDGALPGAYAQGLTTSGVMDLSLTGSGKTRIGYRPDQTNPLSIQKIETLSDWTVYDLQADIESSANLFELNGKTNKSVADISLSNIRARLEREIDVASLNLTSSSLSANGTLERSSTAADVLTQNWNIDFGQALITSDDLPGPDTKITIPNGQLKANLTTGQAPYFDMTTPSADVQTQLVKVDNMALRLYGRSDNYDIEHNGGQVKLSNNTLPPLPIEGQLNVKDGRFIGTSNARLPQADNTPITMTYDIYDGTGFADVEIEALEFSPNGLQPQNLISALRGKIAQVEGIASAKIHLKFARGQPLQSSGTAKITNMNLGTAPGPLTGMNMELTMDSVLPLISRGKQRITVELFDPGIPLQDGIIDFELIDGGVNIFSAKWPIEDGFFSLDPFTWEYGARENRLTMRLSDVELSNFMENIGNESIEATGQLQGEFPIVISGVNLHVDKGKLTIKDGGTIRYNPKTADNSPPISYTQEEAIKILRTKDQARYSSLARDALREFKYKALSVTVDGTLDGEVELHTIFSGSNAKVLNGQPFEFDVNIVGELFNILRSFDSNAQIKSQLEKQGISTEGLSITPQ
ncbi:MAG: YdbH domain-containing protein [Litorimonas sp.]